MASKAIFLFIKMGGLARERRMRFQDKVRMAANGTKIGSKREGA
jgi:hypothetical protein